MKKKNLRDEAYYKSLSMFLIGTIGLLLMTYIAFGLVMTTIKAYRLMDLQKNEKTIPSEVGTVRRYLDPSKEADLKGEKVAIDVVVKEVFGEIISLNNNIMTVETNIYGDETKSVRVKLDEEGVGRILRYEVSEKDNENEVELSLDDLKEGMYVGVKLPVEVLLSEIENDLIYVDDIIVDIEYEEGTEE